MVNRPKMTREDRAKQFMPFAALKGYPEALAKKEKWFNEGGGSSIDRAITSVEKGLGISTEADRRAEEIKYEDTEVYRIYKESNSVIEEREIFPFFFFFLFPHLVPRFISFVMMNLTNQIKSLPLLISLNHKKKLPKHLFYKC